MNELIKIEINENNEQVVSGRELHRFLEVGTRYDKWIGRKIEKYEFIQNIDYVVVAQKRPSNEIKGFTEATDHLLKIPIAKEVSMTENNEKGKHGTLLKWCWQELIKFNQK